MANRPGHLCAALLALLGLTCGIAGQAQTLAQAQASAPRPPASRTELLLAVRINGTAQADNERIIALGNGQLAANAQALQRWRMRIPAVTPIPFEGQDYYPLDAIPQLSYQLDQATQELQVRIAPAALLPSGISEATALQRKPSVSPGGFFNYDLLTQRDSLSEPSLIDGETSRHTSSGLFEAGIFNQYGVGSTTLLWQNPGTPQNFTRLDTAWIRDDPESMSRFQVGDNITSAGTWGRAVRFGGLQWRSNFDTQPGFITFPQPGAAGIATLPSTVDVYVNNARRLSQAVPPGPFEISNVPVITGAGEVQLVVTDLLGRQQVITDHYYASRSLLREGLSDFAYEAGVVREDYGLHSNHYGQSFGTATHRYGVSDHFTRELRAEVVSGEQTAGVGGAYLWPGLGIAQAALAASHGHDGGGTLWMLGMEHVSQGVSWSVREQGGSEDFTELGWVINGSIRPRRIQSMFLGFPIAGLGGSLSLNSVNQRYWGQADTKLGSISYSRSLLRDFFFTAYGTKSTTSETDPSYLIGFSIGTYLGERTSASMQVNRQQAGSDTIVQVQKNLPQGSGFGYRLMADQGINQRQEANGAWQTGIGTYSAGASHQADISSTRLGASGGVAFLGGSGFLSPRIDDSFAVVDAGGYPDVRVYYENRLAGTTDSEGEVLIPHLLPYQQNRISVEESDLPIEAQLDVRELLIIPALRSGAKAEFPIRTVHGGILTIVLADGSYFPAGGKVVILDQGEEYPVGQRGEVFLPKLHETNQLLVVWQHQACEIIVNLPPNSPPLADLGRRTCSGVKPQ